MSNRPDNSAFWMVWRRCTGKIIQTHPFYASAVAEAERLAAKEGDTFYVLRAETRVRPMPPSPPPLEIVALHL